MSWVNGDREAFDFPTEEEARKEEWENLERDPCDHFDGDCVTGKHDCINCWLMDAVNKSDRLIAKDVCGIS